MSTWQQHAQSSATIHNLNPIGNHSNPTHASNVIEVQENLGEINHTSSLSGDFGLFERMKHSSLSLPNLDFFSLGNLYNQSEYSDIELIVESECFYAHRIILAARSDYFRALLYGGLRESQQNNPAIEIQECKAAAFQILLRYIYTGRVNLLKEKVNRSGLSVEFCIWGK